MNWNNNKVPAGVLKHCFVSFSKYKCVYCGDVQESHPIPASVAAVKDFYGKVKDAQANGTVTYDSGKLYTISDYLLKKMSERNDVAAKLGLTVVAK